MLPRGLTLRLGNGEAQSSTHWESMCCPSLCTPEDMWKWHGPHSPPRLGPSPSGWSGLLLVWLGLLSHARVSLSHWALVAPLHWMKG